MAAKKKTIRIKGEKPITFTEGGLHKSTGTKKGAKIPASKHKAAREGKLGPKAKKQEVFYENYLSGGRGKKKK